MNKSKILAQLALAGIASGMLSLTQCGKAQEKRQGREDAPGANQSSSAQDSGENSTAMSDSTKMDMARMDTVKTPKHDCKGMNTCKGQGGCAVSKTQLEELAKNAGTPIAKAGQPHSCKGLNDCKGLGGCNM